MSAAVTTSAANSLPAATTAATSNNAAAVLEPTSRTKHDEEDIEEEDDDDDAISYESDYVYCEEEEDANDDADDNDDNAKDKDCHGASQAGIKRKSSSALDGSSSHHSCSEIGVEVKGEGGGMVKATPALWKTTGLEDDDQEAGAATTITNGSSSSSNSLLLSPPATTQQQQQQQRQCLRCEVLEVHIPVAQCSTVETWLEECHQHRQRAILFCSPDALLPAMERRFQQVLREHNRENRYIYQEQGQENNEDEEDPEPQQRLVRDALRQHRWDVQTVLQHLVHQNNRRHFLIPPPPREDMGLLFLPHQNQQHRRFPPPQNRLNRLRYRRAMELHTKPRRWRQDMDMNMGMDIDIDMNDNNEAYFGGPIHMLTPPTTQPTAAATTTATTTAALPEPQSVPLTAPVPFRGLSIHDVQQQQQQQQQQPSLGDNPMASATTNTTTNTAANMNMNMNHNDMNHLIQLAAIQHANNANDIENAEDYEDAISSGDAEDETRQGQAQRGTYEMEHVSHGRQHVAPLKKEEHSATADTFLPHTGTGTGTGTTDDQQQPQPPTQQGGGILSTAGFFGNLVVATRNIVTGNTNTNSNNADSSNRDERNGKSVVGPIDIDVDDEIGQEEHDTTAAGTDTDTDTDIGHSKGQAEKCSASNNQNSNRDDDSPGTGVLQIDIDEEEDEEEKEDDDIEVVVLPGLQQQQQQDPEAQDTGFVCGICMDDDVPLSERYSMGCGHFFCIDCWKGYLEHELQETARMGIAIAVNQNFPPSCPKQYCQHKVDDSSVIQVLTPHLLPLYQSLVVQPFVQGHPDTMRMCPGPDCLYIAVQSRPGLFLNGDAAPARARQQRQQRGQNNNNNNNNKNANDRPRPGGGAAAAAAAPNVNANVNANAIPALFVCCDACHTEFCFDCGERPHPNQTCQEFATAEQQRQQQGGANQNAAAAATAVAAIAAAAAAAADGARTTTGRGNNNNNNNQAKIQKCPSCTIDIEKNGGCNHMTCKCGHQFCWLCRADTRGAHSTHFCGQPNARAGNRTMPQLFPHLEQEDVHLDYICEALERQQQEQQQQQHDSNDNANEDGGGGVVAVVDNNETTAENRRVLLQKYNELQRFAHYYNRFTAHGQGQEFAENQCECIDHRANQFMNVSDIFSGTDTDFFYLANQRLVASRRLLKYTYCYAYYNIPPGYRAEDSNSEHQISNQMALFLQHQERLERVTEQLSFLSENALTRADRRQVVDMINTVDRCMHALTEFS